MRRLSSLAARLGGPRLAGAIVIDALGSGAVMPLSVLFFTLHQHLRPTTVGLALTLSGAIAMVASPLVGQLIDGIGPKRALIIGWLVSAVAAGCWPLVHGLAPLMAVQTTDALMGGLIWNGSATLLTSRSNESEMSVVMGTQYSLKNFGLGIGGLLATVALAAGGLGFDLAIVLNAMSFVVGAALVAGVPGPVRRVPDTEDDPVTIWTVLRDRRYVGLAMANGIIGFHQVGLSIVLPLWVVLETHAPKAIVGLLFTMNTVIVVVAQTWFSARVRELADTPRAYLRGTAAMSGSAAAFLLAHFTGAMAAVGLLVVGSILLTVCEMWGSSCGFVVSLKLAHEDHRGKYLSVFGIGWGIENTAGPLVGTALVAAGALAPWSAILLLVAAGSGASVALLRGVLAPAGVR